MIEVVKPVYKYGKEDELTKEIEKLLKDLEAENEGVIMTIMSMTLDDSERREKTFWETITNPENYQELVTLQSRNSVLEFVISELKDKIYSDYETVPLPQKRELVDDFRGMTKAEQGMWFGTQVKPLVKGGMTVQQDVADNLNVYPNTLSNRVKIVYGVKWKQYVESVQQGIF